MVLARKPISAWKLQVTVTKKVRTPSKDDDPNYKTFGAYEVLAEHPKFQKALESFPETPKQSQRRRPMSQRPPTSRRIPTSRCRPTSRRRLTSRRRSEISMKITKF